MNVEIMKRNGRPCSELVYSEFDIFIHLVTLLHEKVFESIIYFSPVTQLDASNWIECGVTAEMDGYIPLGHMMDYI